VVKPQGKEVTTTNLSLDAAPVPRKPLNFAALKSQISIVDILRSHGWTAHTSKGHQHRGPCLIHQAETTDRSFAVHSAKNTFCCHSCGCQGNAIDLIVALSKQPLLEAVWNWIEQAGIEPTLLEKQAEKRKAVKQAIA
jgi:DNA primase